MLRHIATQEDITVREAEVMDIIYHEGIINPKDISNILCLNNICTTRILKKLRSQSYIDEVINKEDKRKIDISLTDKGLQICKRIREIYSARTLQILNEYGVEKLKEPKNERSSMY